MRLTAVARPRVTRTALWLVGIVIVLAASWASFEVPVQADDLLAFVGVPRAGSLPPPFDIPASIGRFITAFLGGRTDHFAPLGLATEESLKRTMRRATDFGLTASGVHHATLAVLTVAGYAASTALVSGLLRRRRGTPRPYQLAVPIAIAYAACVQITTPWSTYDPLVSHPVFGSLVTVVGITYLAVLTRALNGARGRLSTLAGTVLGLAGVSLYEGFYPFLLVAALMVLISWASDRSPERTRAQLRLSGWFLAPAAVLIAVSRTISLFVSHSDYQGTAVHVGAKGIAAWTTSIHSTAPAGSWSQAFAAIANANLSLRYSYLPAILVGVCASTLLLIRHHSSQPHSSQQQSGPTTEPLSTAATGIWPVASPLLALILLNSALFAMTVLWADYLARSGMTYMGATTAYWSWAMAGGLLLHAATTRCRSTIAAVAIVVAVGMVTWFQTSLNEAVARAELSNPTPFGFDLVRMVDDGTQLDEQERCALLWQFFDPSDHLHLDTLNWLYVERHQMQFCTSDRTP